jgi:hypothetical protein
MEEKDFNPKVKEADFKESNRVDYFEVKKNNYYYAKTISDMYYWKNMID